MTQRKDSAKARITAEDLTRLLSEDQRVKARSLIQQVKQQNYNPPRRDRVLEWMQKQGFPICPNPENPDSCNLYKNLEFPQEVYEHIGDYRAQKAEVANEGDGRA
ncbi:MAG: hypothetical protein M3Y27_06780 [Acidobacteriota bacterium]|nr:hypothetical protein [Acidobacteriota bacterium]